MTPGDPEIYGNWIASKAPEPENGAEEVGVIEGMDAVEDATTCFPRTEDGVPFCWDYQIKGFFKDACSALRRVPGTRSSKLTAFKKVIDGTVFVEQRRIPFQLPEGAECGRCERPLRASSASGERVALAASETVPAGTVLEFSILVMNPKDAETVREWLDYGALRGLFQWRNSGKGRFEWEDKTVLLKGILSIKRKDYGRFVELALDAGMREALAGDYDEESQSGEFWFDAEKEGPRGILNWLGFSVEDETEDGIDFVFFEDSGIAAYRDDMGRAVFEACAPVIGAGSVLVFMENWDEAEEKDPRIWRYTFDGEKMHVQDGRFVFD